VYCDFKPDNVMHQGEDVKLIDLGGVRRLNDDTSAIYGTVGFQAPEVPTMGTSISSDTYTVARTLAVLTLDFPGYQRDHQHSLPDPAATPLFGEHESLYRWLVKGTAENPDDRFQSVEELTDQLLGVLREVVAIESKQPRPVISTRFTADRWSGDNGRDPWQFVASDLPGLKPNSEDPSAAFIAELVGVSPEDVRARIDAELARLGTPSVELQLRKAGARLEMGEPIDSELAAIEALDPWEWRVSWLRAVASLAGLSGADAVAELDRVRTDVPGELAPKLASAVAAERAGETDEAIELYERILAIDPQWVSAAFGLARCHRARADEPAAVAALQRIPRQAAAWTDGQGAVATLRLDAARRGDPAALADAERALTVVAADPAKRSELTVSLLASMLDGVRSGAIRPSGGATVLGTPVAERDLRFALEKAYREQARYVDDPTQRIALVDLANSVRPVTLF
jgi:serine/threonine-protein kinase PknG